jgi:hypothetical protein
MNNHRNQGETHYDWKHWQAKDRNSKEAKYRYREHRRSRKKWANGLDCQSDQQPSARCRRASEHRLNPDVILCLRIRHADKDYDHRGRGKESGEAGRGARNAPKPPSDRDRHVDDISAGHDLAKAKYLVELFGTQPCAFFYERKPRVGKNAAEAGQPECQKASAEFAHGGIGRFGVRGGAHLKRLVAWRTFPHRLQVEHKQRSLGTRTAG